MSVRSFASDMSSRTTDLLQRFTTSAGDELNKLTGREPQGRLEHEWEILMGEHFDDEAAVDAFWTIVKARGPHLFFDDIKFDSLGGFQDVANLTDPESPGGYGWKARALWALVALFFAIYNTEFLITNDLNSCPEEERGYYLLSKSLLLPIFKLLDAYGMNLDSHYWHECGPILFIHYAELGALVVIYIRLFRNSLLATFKTRNFCRYLCGEAICREQSRWFALARIFWRDIQEIGAVSGMRALSLFQATQFTYAMGNLNTKRAVVIFVLKIIAVFIFGIDTFLVKTRAIRGTILGTPDHPATDLVDIHQILTPLIFARQLASVVDIPDLINERLFVFIFAGEDSVLQKAERAKKEVWNGMMVEAMWKMCYNSKESVWRAVCKFGILMLSWSDYDFQKLVLEPEHTKSRFTSRLFRSPAS